MKKLYILLILHMFLSYSVEAQDDTWLIEQTDEVGLTDVKGAKTYVADINGDHYPDLILITGEQYFENLFGVRVFINEPNPNNGGRRFTEVADAAGLLASRTRGTDGRRVTQLAIADVDNDGDNDVLTGVYWHRKETLADNGDRAEVLLNDGMGNFSLAPDSTLYSPGRMNAQGLSFLDYDLDGNIDVFYGNWSWDHTQNFFQHDELFKGLGDGGFDRVSQNLGLHWVAAEPLYGSSAGDWDMDGYPDIFTAPYCRTKGRLWHNEAGAKFNDVSVQAGYDAQFMAGDNGQALCMWSAYPADYDNDGDFDFFFTLVHGGLGLTEGRSTIVENMGPDSNYVLRWRIDKIERRPRRPNHQADYEACWVDINNDGLQDIIIGQGTYPSNDGRLYVELQNDQHEFEDITGVGKLGLNTPFWSPVNRVRTIDFDLDGDDDFLLSYASGNTLALFRNDIGNVNNHVSFKIIGPEGTNKNAIGAKIYVYYNGEFQLREVHAGQGNASGQNGFIQNFGIGGASKVDSAIIILPNKEQTKWVIEEPEINRLHIVDEAYMNPINITEDISVFPNPSSGNIIHLVLGEKFGEGKHTVIIYDLAGKEISQHELEGEIIGTPLKVSFPSNGMFIVKVYSDNGESGNFKLIRGQD